MQLGKGCLLVVCVVLAFALAVLAAPMARGGGQLFVGDSPSAYRLSASPSLYSPEIVFSASSPDTLPSLAVVPVPSRIIARADPSRLRLAGPPTGDLMIPRWIAGLAAGVAAWLCLVLGIRSVLHVEPRVWLSMLSTLAVAPRAPPY